MVDLAAEDPAADLATLRDELAAYDPDLVVRPSIVVGTKADLVDHPSALEPDALVVSGETGQGLDELLDRLAVLTKEAEELEPERAPFVVLRPGRPRFTVEREGSGWRVKGQTVERWILETDMDDEAQLVKLQKRLAKEGVERRLTELGARAGDEVAIRDKVFEFLPGDRIQEGDDGR
jgi:GTP-binding protein